MEQPTKIGIGIFVSIIVFLSGMYTEDFNTDNYDMYKCESRDLVGPCYKLSSGIGTRCYYNLDLPTKYKSCKEGWLQIVEDVQREIVTEESLFDDVSPIFIQKQVWHTTSPNGEKCYKRGLLTEVFDCE